MIQNMVECIKEKLIDMHLGNFQIVAGMFLI
jgi:hypothetical protein